MDRRPVLRDLAADERLADQGYATVPFLSDTEVAGLLEIYAALVPRSESGVQLDFVREDRDLVRRLSKELKAVLEPRVEEAFTDHWPVLTSFIVKHPGPGSDFYLHRDVPANDERTTRCFTLWIPLVDVGPAHDNGGLGIVPGSQHLPSGHYGFDASVLTAPFADHLRTLLLPIALDAGSGLVYDAGLLHGSAENRSAAPRPAIGCVLGRRSEPLVHVVPTGRRGRRLFAIDRDFFIDHHPGEIVTQGMAPGYELLEEFDDDESLPVELLRRVVGDVPDAAVATPIPVDLVDRAFPASVLLPSRSSGLIPPDEDLPLPAAELGPLERDVAGAEVTGEVPEVGALVLVASGRQVHAPPPSLPPLGRWAGGPATRDLALLSLDAGARLHLVPPRRRGTRHELAVLDGPRVRAGLATPAATTMLEPGRAVDLAAEVPHTLWNEGPGPLVVLVRRSVGRAVTAPDLSVPVPLEPRTPSHGG